MIRQTPFLAVCVAAWLTAPFLTAQETRTVEAYPSTAFASIKGGCGCDQKDAGGDLGDYMLDEGMADGESYVDPQTESLGLLAAGSGVTPGAMSGMPGMIGDFFATGYRTRLPSFGQIGHNFDDGTSIAVAAGDRRFKISDANSPFPVDRVFFNYHHFHNPLITGAGSDANLDRGMFGIEKTFVDGLYSLEARFPFASGLNSSQRVDGVDNLATEFGNIGLAVKRLVYRGCTVSASIGLGMVLPTAESTSITGLGSTPQTLEIENEAFYLQPFFGVYWAPNERLFTQFFMQADFDTTGNSFTFSSGENFVLQDQALLFTDFSAGYWVYRNPCRWFTGLAPMIELHHTTTLEDADFAETDSNDQITNFANRQDFLNMTGGLRFEFGGRTYLTASGVAPLSTLDNRAFDAEFSLELVRLY